LTPQPVQLNTAQVEKMCENLQKRITAKTLECASLDELRKMAAPFLGRIVSKLGLVPDVSMAGDPEGPCDALSAMAENYLTALFNQELITLEEWQIQLRGYQAALRQMQSGILTPTGMKVGRG